MGYTDGLDGFYAPLTWAQGNAFVPVTCCPSESASQPPKTLIPGSTEGFVSSKRNPDCLIAIGLELLDFNFLGNHEGFSIQPATSSAFRRGVNSNQDEMRAFSFSFAYFKGTAPQNRRPNFPKWRGNSGPQSVV